MVIVNLFFIILTTEFAYSQAQYSLGISDLPWQGISEHTFEITEYIFCAIYLLDVTIRVFVLRKEWYYDHIEGWMYLNMFDALLVAANLVELIALPVPGPYESWCSRVRARTICPEGYPGIGLQTDTHHSCTWAVYTSCSL